MLGQGARTPGQGLTSWQWFSEVQRICREWAEYHKDGTVEDVWTGTKRDHAKKDFTQLAGRG